jgi:hypothetical protein
VAEADGVRRLVVPALRVVEPVGTDRTLQEVLRNLTGFARRCGCRELIIEASQLPPEPVLEAALARLARRNGLRREGGRWRISIANNVVPFGGFLGAGA